MLHVIVYLGYAACAANLIMFWKTNRLMFLFFGVGQLLLANFLNALISLAGL